MRDFHGAIPVSDAPYREASNRQRSGIRIRACLSGPSGAPRENGTSKDRAWHRRLRGHKEPGLP